MHKSYTPHCNKSQFIHQKNLLERPVLGTRFYGEHAFSFGGPLLWNTVPLHLKEANCCRLFKAPFENLSFRRIWQGGVTISGAPPFSSSLSSKILALKRIETQWQCKIGLYKNCCYHYYHYSMVFLVCLQMKKVDLMENLLIELDDRKRMVEVEHQSMELTGGTLTLIQLGGPSPPPPPCDRHRSRYAFFFLSSLMHLLI